MGTSTRGSVVAASGMVAERRRCRGRVRVQATRDGGRQAPEATRYDHHEMTGVSTTVGPSHTTRPASELATRNAVTAAMPADCILIRWATARPRNLGVGRRRRTTSKVVRPAVIR